MNAKAGIFRDYDLMANREDSAQGVTCAVCDTPSITFQWSDYYGEGMCIVCGCPYQLKGGSKEEEAEGKYPYMTLRGDFLPLAREYWKATRSWVYYGSSISRNDGMPGLILWIKANHPEYIAARESEPDTDLAPTEKVVAE